jgi:hypothetical protein
MKVKETCGSCRFFKFAEPQGSEIEFGFDGVCIVEPPTLPTNSQCKACHLHKFRNDKVFGKNGNKFLSNIEYVKISNKALSLMVEELRDEDETVNPIEMMFVLSAMHRTIFANVELQDGIDKAREYTEALMDLIEITMKEGAKDELKQEDL